MTLATESDESEAARAYLRDLHVQFIVQTLADLIADAAERCGQGELIDVDELQQVRAAVRRLPCVAEYLTRVIH